MIRLLALETSTEACSVALSIDGDVRERFELAPRKHAERVLPMIDELLAEAGIGKRQLDAIAVARGPGAFTGVRLALAVAQGIAVALGLPLLPISSLAALAQTAVDTLQTDGGAQPPTSLSLDDCRWLALADARMGEIYTGAFIAREGRVVADGVEAVLPVAAIDAPSDRPLVLIGNGYAAHRAALDGHFGARAVLRLPEILPHAAAMIRLAERDWHVGVRVDPALVEPTYLRDKVALTKAERGV